MVFRIEPGTHAARVLVYRDDELLFSAEPAIAAAAVELFNAAVLPVYECRVGPGEWRRADFAVMLPNGVLDAKVGGRRLHLDPSSYRIGSEFQPEKVTRILMRLTAGRQVVDG